MQATGRGDSLKRGGVATHRLVGPAFATLTPDQPTCRPSGTALTKVRNLQNTTWGSKLLKKNQLNNPSP